MVAAAAPEIMKLKAVDDTCVDVPKADVSKASKKEYLDKLSELIVNGYVLNTAQNRELVNRILEVQRESRSSESKDSSECDDMPSYQKALMEYGLLLLNF